MKPYEVFAEFGKSNKVKKAKDANGDQFSHRLFKYILLVFKPGLFVLKDT